MSTPIKSALAEMEERHAQERAEMVRKEAVLPLLPIEPRYLCAHTNKTHQSVSASYEVKTLADAMAIYRAYLPSIVDAEAWRGGCVSVQPAEINRYSETKDARSTMEFTAHAEIHLHSFGDKAHYQEQEMKFFARIGVEWVRVGIKIESAWQRIAYWSEGSGRNPGSLVIRFPSLGEDSHLRWWSEAHNYSRSYYWADTHNFVSAMEHEIAQLAKKGLTP